MPGGMLGTSRAAAGRQTSKAGAGRAACLLQMPRSGATPACTVAAAPPGTPAARACRDQGSSSSQRQPTRTRARLLLCRVAEAAAQAKEEFHHYASCLDLMG